LHDLVVANGGISIASEATTAPSASSCFRRLCAFRTKRGGCLGDQRCFRRTRRFGARSARSLRTKTTFLLPRLRRYQRAASSPVRRGHLQGANLVVIVLRELGAT